MEKISSKTISYQDRVFMCTNSCSKPLVGLEFLGFNIIVQIKIFCKGCKGEKGSVWISASHLKYIYT